MMLGMALRGAPALVATLLAALAATLLTVSLPLPCSAAAKLATLSLGMLPVVDNLPFYVANRDGFNKRRGIEVKFVPFASAVERDTALRVGAIDGCLADIVMAAVMENSGFELSIVSLGLGAAPTEGRFAVLGAPGGDVKSMRDLKGEGLGISGNTIVEYVADQLIKAAGLKVGDVSKVDMPKLPIRVEMLLAGKLKAAVLPDPMAAYAIARGARLIADDTKVNLSQTVIVFGAEALRTKGQAVRQLLAAYAEAAVAVNAAPEDYRELLAVTANVPENIKRSYKIDHYPPPQLPEVDDVDRVTAWMLQKRLLQGPMPYDRLVDSGFVAPKKR